MADEMNDPIDRLNQMSSSVFPKSPSLTSHFALNHSPSGSGAAMQS